MMNVGDQMIKVKTSVGNSEVEDIVMQGEAVSCIMCTSSMDMISKECKEVKYNYRKELEIPKLGRFTVLHVSLHASDVPTSNRTCFLTKKL